MNIKEKRVTKIWVKMNKNCKIYLAKKVQIRKVMFKIKWIIISLKSLKKLKKKIFLLLIYFKILIIYKIQIMKKKNWIHKFQISQLQKKIYHICKIRIFKMYQIMILKKK